jgi:transcriptional regulator with XRE-family HTH domain
VVYEREDVRSARLRRELEKARDELTLADSIILALRDARTRNRTSQRTHAVASGLSKSTVSRLESTPGRLRLDDVVAALDGTGYHVRLCHDADGSPVEAGHWSASELIARYRDGRRLPADASAQRALTTPTWFTARHGYDVPTPEWTWRRSDPRFRLVSESEAARVSLRSKEVDAQQVEPPPAAGPILG